MKKKLVTDRRLWLTADQNRVVEEGDPAAAFLLVAYGVADVMIYRSLVFREIRQYEWGPSKSALYGCLDAHKLTYRDRRTESTSAALSDRQEDALVLTSLQSVKGEIYTTSYDLAQHDACWPDYFFYFFTPGMDQLLSARGWGKPYFEFEVNRGGVDLVDLFHLFAHGQRGFGQSFQGIAVDPYRHGRFDTALEHPHASLDGL